MFNGIYILQIHCFSPTTLLREYILHTNPVVMSCPGSGGIGFGPLAVGPRWLAYSGIATVIASSGRVSPQHLTPSASFPGFSSNGSLVAHYAKESSKHLAAGIVNLGDMGYKKLSSYCSELLPDNSGSVQSVNSSTKGNGIIHGHSTDVESVGMVIMVLYNKFSFTCNSAHIVLDYLLYPNTYDSTFPVLGCIHLVFPYYWLKCSCQRSCDSGNNSLVQFCNCSRVLHCVSSQVGFLHVYFGLGYPCTIWKLMLVLLIFLFYYHNLFFCFRSL